MKSGNYDDWHCNDFYDINYKYCVVMIIEGWGSTRDHNHYVHVIKVHFRQHEKTRWVTAPESNSNFKQLRLLIMIQHALGLVFCFLMIMVNSYCADTINWSWVLKILESMYYPLADWLTDGQTSKAIKKHVYKCIKLSISWLTKCLIGVEIQFATIHPHDVIFMLKHH